MDIVNDLFPILKDLGIFGLIVWGIQKIISNSSEKKFADYKSYIDMQLMSYKNQYDKQIEEYKSQLKFLNDRLGALHSERLKIIKELNDRLVKLNSAMVRLASARPVDPDKNKDREIEQQVHSNAQTAYAEYNHFIMYNKIYFEKPFADKLLKIRDEYFNAHWDFFEFKWFENSSSVDEESYRTSRRKVIDALRLIREDIPKYIDEIEDDFRLLLGVNHKSVA